MHQFPASRIYWICPSSRRRPGAPYGNERLLTFAITSAHTKRSPHRWPCGLRQIRLNFQHQTHTDTHTAYCPGRPNACVVLVTPVASGGRTTVKQTIIIIITNKHGWHGTSGRCRRTAITAPTTAAATAEATATAAATPHRINVASTEAEPWCVW